MSRKGILHQQLKPLRKRLAAARDPLSHAKQDHAPAPTPGATEEDLFAHATRDVTPLRAPPRVPARAPRPTPLPRQRWRDEREVLQESLTDPLDAGVLLQSDGRLSFRRPGIGPDVPARLRRGRWTVQAELDLHGLRREEAHATLNEFLRRAHQEGLRCVRVIHGKGLGSPGGVPVLKPRVHSWLARRREVLAFVQARPLHGGAGALLVLLARTNRPAHTASENQTR